MNEQRQADSHAQISVVVNAPSFFFFFFLFVNEAHVRSATRLKTTTQDVANFLEDVGDVVQSVAS